MRFTTPSGVELWIGRNNRQNDRLTFRSASDYDIWFHSQEIAGSHVLLRLTPGTVPEAADLQFAADYAAYYSRARHSEQVPVVYTRPKYVYKPKGAKPGRGLRITAKNNFLPNCLLFFTQNGYCLLQFLLERQMQFRRLGTQELYFLGLQQQTTANQW
jgi:hypothetical protein